MSDQSPESLASSLESAKLGALVRPLRAIPNKSAKKYYPHEFRQLDFLKMKAFYLPEDPKP